VDFKITASKPSKLKESIKSLKRSYRIQVLFETMGLLPF